MEVILRKQLKQWQHEFRAQHGREPSKEDIQRHPEVASTYDTWRAISKASSDAPRSRKRRAETSPAPAAPSTPVKARKPAPPSPANPFRSPGRRPPPPGELAGPGASRNPFRSPQKPQPTYTSPARVRRAPPPPADSDISDDDDGPSMLVPASASAASPEAAPAARASPAPPRHYTPRTKARKRLRGEDVRTPPSAKRKGAFMSQASLLLAPSPRGSGVPQKRRIFSAPHASLEERASSPEEPERSTAADEDMIGPSPQRPRPRMDVLSGAPREFRPLFRTTSQDANSVGWALPVAHSGDSDAEEPDDAPSPAQLDRALISASPSGHAPPKMPASQPAEDLELDLEEPGELSIAPGAPRISVRPYRRYGSMRAQRSPEASDEEFDALLWSVSQGTDADSAAPEADMSDGAEALPGLTGLSLHSPVRHMQRAAERQRERADALVHGLLDEDDASEKGPSTGAVPHRLFRRAGRSGLDVEEDESGARHDGGGALSDDAWASEASSADYGLGDGEMDATDVLDM